MIDNLERRIDLMEALGRILQDPDDPRMIELKKQAFIKNNWFTVENSSKALEAVGKAFLGRSEMERWSGKYEMKGNTSKRVGMILAGNIPAVGFHDLLCTFLSGHKSIIRCSSKDDVLIPGIVHILTELEPGASDHFEIGDQLKYYDAVIATGGDAAAVHFKYYFSSVPHIIRKNRNAVAVLDGSESKDDLAALGCDIFDYFGLGCRSVSKIYIPRDFDMNLIFGALLPYADVIDHNKYKNNYDYNYAIYTLGQEAFLTNGFVIFKEDRVIASRIACVHYEFYDDLFILGQNLRENEDQIQCISANVLLKDLETVRLGQCQNPRLEDYADGVDTMQFLSKI